MPNFLFNAWVKIVNNLRTLGRITHNYSSPICLHKQHKYVIRIVKVCLTGRFIPQPSTTRNTPKTPKTYLLNKSFTHFPQDLLISPINEN